MLPGSYQQVIGLSTQLWCSLPNSSKVPSKRSDNVLRLTLLSYKTCSHGADSWFSSLQGLEPCKIALLLQLFNALFGWGTWKLLYTGQLVAHKSNEYGKSSANRQ